MSKPNNPHGYQKRRSPKKSTRPVVGPGREPEHHPVDVLKHRKWLVLGGAVLLAVGLTLGLVFGLGGSSPTTPATGVTTTTTHPLTPTSTTLPTSGTTTTVPGTTTTVPATTTTTP